MVGPVILPEGDALGNKATVHMPQLS